MVKLGPRVSRLRAPNPSPMTLDGTNGYIVDGGNGAWIAIDPGPDDPAHIAAFIAAGLGRIASEHFFPSYLNFWQYGTLLSLSIAPVIVVWVAVV